MLPSVFPPFNPSTSLSDDCNESRFAFTNGNSNSNSIEGLKAKNKAVYRADLRQQLLGGGTQRYF